ncbi:hypothetical protein EDC56_3247 [Sinobacterium caligoides]|uniref:Uncharacterized protein n=1 Tax=Sinobacterium caligoides TaxID=933926 RepID=A0A3N2DGT2_9GAMM|nr:hypothetical protein [Sinobacterium caligoides]ROR99007.1 hypothetical protein EDC56_3247 [Sinobacterium caligoides]
MASNIYLLPLAASICLTIALIQAWFMTMVRYLKLEAVKKLFPGYRNLVRSHIDYLMMASLIFSLYLVIVNLGMILPSFILWLIFIGALYNPFGFLLQAIKPDIADGNDLMSKAAVVLGFLPLTIGLGWSAIAVMVLTGQKLLG